MTLWYSVEGIKSYLSTTGRGARLKNLKAMRGYTSLKPKNKAIIEEVFAANIGAKKKKGPTKRRRSAKAAKAAAGPSAKKSRSKMTVPELKAELKKLGLPVSGKKAVLLERLKNA